MTSKEIIAKLPYTKPFLFVDEIVSVSENDIEGLYTFNRDAFFYEGHFKNNPITPGVILTECMAQIGLACLGIYLLSEGSNTKNMQIAMSSTEMDFLKPVFPEEAVRVVSSKEYFRFNKLKCTVKMFNAANELVCNGTISGMVISAKL